MKIITKQVRGSRKEICEDSIHVRQEGARYLFAGVADGQSRKKHCVEGGKTVLDITADYMKTQDLSRFSGRYADEVQYELIRTVRERLKALAEAERTGIEEFSSTICAVAMSPRDGNYSAVHLGDGWILGVTEEGRLRVLSAPENGITHYDTYLTTSPGAMTHIRLGSGNLRNYRALYLMTDGAEKIWKGTAAAREAQSLLIRGDFEGISRCLEEMRPRDDASLIMIKT